jgi:hypothetical protein
MTAIETFPLHAKMKVFMSDGLGQAECRICGRTIFFHRNNSHEIGEEVIELTCSRGHSDCYFSEELSRDELIPVGANDGLSRVAVAGF